MQIAQYTMHNARCPFHVTHYTMHITKYTLHNLCHLNLTAWEQNSLHLIDALDFTMFYTSPWCSQLYSTLMNWAFLHCVMHRDFVTGRHNHHNFRKDNHQSQTFFPEPFVINLTPNNNDHEATSSSLGILWKITFPKPPENTFIIYLILHQDYEYDHQYHNHCHQHWDNHRLN